MANERIYSIKLNGITESVDLVDKLLKKLEDLEKRINVLQGKSVSVGTSGGGGGSSKSRTSDLTAEEKVSKKIQQTAEKIAEARTEEYKALQQAKSDLKEIERQQKAVAAAQNLSGENAKQYANTLDGMRIKLADMKRAVGGIDISSPEFEKQVQEIDKLNSKIKEIEQSYGQYGRNVGNYANGVAEGLTKVTIKVGETERTFNSAKEASRTLGNELKSMAVNGEDNTQAYKDLDEAFKKLESTMKDVSASSKMMDNLLDTMQGLTAIGSIGQGFSALFGFDDSEMEKSIQKLVALQNILQGLETLQKQMTTEEGIGALFKNASGSVDEFVAKLTGAKVGINGLEASSKSATIAVKGLSTAIKAVGIGVLIQLISQAVDQIKEFASEIKTGLKDAWNQLIGGERYTAMEQLAAGIENINKKLEIRLQLINEDKSLSEWGKQTSAIYEVNKALKEQLDLYLQLNKEGNSFFKNMAKNAGEFADNLLSNPSGSLGKLGLATGKQIIESLNDWKAARKSNEELEQSVGSLGNSVKKATRQVSADAEEMVNRWVEEIDKCDIKTEEGRQKFQELSRALDDDSVLNSVLLNLDRYIDSPETRAAIESMIARIRQLRGELSAPIGSLTSNVSKWIKSQEKWAKDIIKKHEEKEKDGVKSTGAKVGETIEQQEQELTRLRIRAMNDGLPKIIAEINYNARKEIDALKLTGARKAEAEALIEQERQRKIENAQKEHFQKMLEERKKYEDKIAEMTLSNSKAYVENIINGLENGLQELKNIPYNTTVRKSEKGDYYEKIFDEIFFLNPDNVDEFLKKNYDEIVSELKETEDFKKLYNEIGLSYDNLLKFVLQKRIENIKALYYEEQKIISDLNFRRKSQLRLDYNTAKDELEKEMKSLLGTSTQNSILADATNKFEIIPDKEKLDKAEQDYKEFIAGIKKQISSLSENDTELFEKLSLQLGGSLGEAYDKGEIGFKEMLERLNAYYKQFTNQRKAEEAKYFNDIQSNSLEGKSKIVSTRVNYYNNLIKEIERQLTSTQNRYGQGQERDAFGIIDLAKTKKLSNETKLTYDNLLKELNNILENVKMSDLPNDEFQNLQTTLESLIRKIKELNNEVNNKNQNIFSDFLQSIMPYVSQLANGLSNILGQVSSLISAEFDSQRQMLEDELALLEENYNAQEELEQRHADKINAIEDEIANARGARRDYLVSLYNEEIEQQRRAFIEKQKIDEEMRRNEEKQKALEKAERKKQNEIQFSQALMSQSLAILNAFATKPFVPVGLAMGALATGLTAVQLALMKKAQQASEKYGNGGIVSGNSHAQGGVKAIVGGQRAIELEGNEFIIRKKTATQNLPLLDYINKSERKLNANDLLEFFKGNQGTKTIRNSFKNKYASGGILPAVTATKTSNIVIIKDESTPVVSVVDIINATDNYNQVRLLAGVNE